MKNFIQICCMIFLSLYLSAQDFYDINTINNIEINFTESNWDNLMDDMASAGNDERLLGSVIINEVQYDSVGVRYKGNSTYRADQTKNPLNIKLDYIIGDQEIQDYGTLKLANVSNDPSFVRETLGYEIARKYFPASGSNYARVTINGTYLGLYTSNQDVDKHFQRTHIGGGGNVRFKGEIGSNATPGSMGGVWQYFGSDTTAYSEKYAIESEFGWGELVEFLDTLNNQNNAIEEVLNLDRHLWFLAFHNLLVNLDGPINNPQNYYLFQDDLGRFNPIPWDLNECFGVFTNLQSVGQLNGSQLQQLSPFINLNESDYPVISNILDNPQYQKMYVAHLRTMLEEVVLSDWYLTRALEIQDIIAAEVDADPNKFYTYANFLSNIYTTVGSGGPRPGRTIIGITDLMDARGIYLSALPEFSAQQPHIGEAVLSTDQISTGSTVSISVTVENATSVVFRYREHSAQAFQQMEMFDDGSHGDGDAGDSHYGTDELLVHTNLDYYFYAENEEAAIFSPEHAANEYFSISATSNLVVNEFMADNEAAVADQDGEYDDWIELYNNTDTEISLDGYFLSDDSSDLTQWMFPDTSIEAHGFLVIWADDDEEQHGLHAGFKLSAEGENIYLLNGDTVVIQSVDYGTQVADSSVGRFPDGTGNFVRMFPTFAASNLAPSVFDDVIGGPESFMLTQNFPNPFNPTTTIRYHLPDVRVVSLSIYDVRGREVKSETFNRAAGWNEYLWDGRDGQGNPIPTGVYLARLQSNDQAEVIKMILMR